MYNQSILTNIAEKHFHEKCISIGKLPQSGSSRQYYRIKFNNLPAVIGVYNEDLSENEAFFSFTHSLSSQNIPVPEIFAISEDKLYYLLQDLGDETLYSFLSVQRKNGLWSEHITDYYKKVIQQLPRIQFTGKEFINFDKCYPRKAFDRQSMQWDLNYFKYYFLKLAHIPFDEQLLENDFNTLINFLLSAENDYFLYRDFQSRNIMIFQDKVYFIDYQGGRKGALQYDIASLLYDGKADIPQSVREELLDYYINILENDYGVSGQKFRSYYYMFVLIRIMQAMGAYGFRGYYEKKAHFLQSIPYAISNIRHILDTQLIPIDIPELKKTLYSIIEKNFLYQVNSNSEKLTVSINSFSYKKGLPEDFSGNGGGFVFDCRSLPNPGRYPEYQSFTGKDECVIHYLEQYSEILEFKNNSNKLVFNAIDNYLDRKFNHLMVSYGCTGGQHRSVYFAEMLVKEIEKRYPEVIVLLRHKENS